ncbi:MAG: S8 family serine peptidase [Flavobacteriales bacterium]
MRKFYLLLALLLTGVVPNPLRAQTVYSEYQDGKIWFKIKEDVRLNLPGFRMEQEASVNYNNLDLTTLNFLRPLSAQHQITKLSRPYWMVKNDLNLSNVFLLEFNDFSNVDVIMNKIKQSGMVEYAERVPLLKHFLTPNDPSFSSSTQWGLFQINAQQAWNISTGSPTVVVAIVDDAIQTNHPDLTAVIYTNNGEIAGDGIDNDGNGYIDDRNGFDVADNDNNPNPPTNAFDHGTHVAGIAGARSNNAVGVASIGYNIRLLPVKATNSSSSVTHGYDGGVYSVNAGAKIINMSWGGTGSSTTASNIINWASNQGVVLVAAAGNDNDNVLHYPAAYTPCIAVASTTTGDVRSSFSCFGTWVDVAAPGSSIYSTTVGSSYGYKQGTSMASPMVAGLAGLIKSVNPSMTATDIRNCILNTAVNINAANPSYVGQLGSGRIDAFAAVNCAAATLNNPPVADFVANNTTISAGASVNFTNLSIYNPTSYSWTFSGGTPGTSTAANPTNIVYSTPGTYTVTLTATNANGSDVETKTAYITVVPTSGCDRPNWSNLSQNGGTWTGTQYYTGAAVGQDGWVNGKNVYNDREKAAYFNVSSNTQGYIEGCWIAFGEAYSATPSKIVPVKVYNRTGANPGTLLATYNLTMGEIMADVQGNFWTEILFPTPIAVPASREFFISVDVNNLSWTAGVKDTLSIISNTNGQTTPSAIWERQTNNNWYQYGTAGTWNLTASLYIIPFLTSDPATVSITSSATSVCAGSSINFDATGSNVGTAKLWRLNGGSPNGSNNMQVTSFYNTAGSYYAKFEMLGGGCDLYKTDSIQITVNPVPNLSITSSDDTICPAGSSQLNVSSAASSYVWSPPTGLSSTNISNPVATPTNTTTYTVTGTLGPCSKSGDVTVVVDNIPPVAEFLYSVPTCINAPVTFNGAVSDFATAYNWTFSGGSIASSVSPGPSVTYAAAGFYPVTLQVTSECGFTDDTTITVQVIDCTISTGDILEDGGISAFIDNNNAIQVTFESASPDKYNLTLVNAMGQIVHNSQEEFPAAGRVVRIPLEDKAQGIYFLRVDNGQRGVVFRFFR